MNTNISLAKAPLLNTLNTPHPSQEGDSPSHVEINTYSTLLLVVTGAVGSLLTIISVMALGDYITSLF